MILNTRFRFGSFKRQRFPSYRVAVLEPEVTVFDRSGADLSA